MVDTPTSERTDERTEMRVSATVATCDCGRAFFRLSGGCMIIESSHGGRTHFNALSPFLLRAIADLLDGGRSP